MAYSLLQMQSLLRQAGWPESLIVTMAAIGMAESSGDACVVGTLANNEYSVGLWQININPALKRPWTRAQLCDPLFNAKVALSIYSSQGLRAWGSYTDGRYKKHIAQSQAVYAPKATPVPTGNTESADNSDSAAYQDTPIAQDSDTNTKILIAAGLGVIALLLFSRT